MSVAILAQMAEALNIVSDSDSDARHDFLVPYTPEEQREREDVEIFVSDRSSETGHYFLTCHTPEEHDEHDNVEILSSDSAVETQVVVQPPLSGRRKGCVKKRARRYCPPKMRSKEEHCMIMSRAREAKARIGQARDRVSFMSVAATILKKTKHIAKGSKGTTSKNARRVVQSMSKWIPCRRKKADRVSSEVVIAGDVDTLRADDLAKRAIHRRGLRGGPKSPWQRRLDWRKSSLYMHGSRRCADHFLRATFFSASMVRKFVVSSPWSCVALKWARISRWLGPLWWRSRTQCLCSRRKALTSFCP